MSLFPNLEKENFSKQPNNSFVSQFQKDVQSYLSSFSIVSQLQKLPKTNLYTLDRLEGNFAIIEDQKNKTFYNVPKKLLPYKCKSGDVLQFVDNCFVHNELETNKARKHIESMLSNLKR